MVDLAEMVVPEIRWYAGKHRLFHRWYGPAKGTCVKYRFKKRPYAHQKEALQDLVKRGWGGALLMQARTGKTKVGVDYASVLHQAGKVNRVLVVVPTTNVMQVWIEHIEENCPFPYNIVVWDKKGRKREPLPKLGRDALDFVLINYDAFSTPAEAKRARDGSIVRSKDGDIVRKKRRGGRYRVRDQIRLWGPQLMILDESHRIKSPSAAKTRMIVSIAWQKRQGKPTECLVPYRVLMTGTPRTKKKRAHDLWTQWQFLNPNRFRGMTLSDFKSHYGRFIAKDNYEMWVGNRNEAELNRKIHKDSYTITREECYDLPKALPDRMVWVDLSTETARVYDEMAEQMIAQIHTGEITEASIALVRSLRLTQITGGVVKTTELNGKPGRLVRIGTEKLDELTELLYDFAEEDEKFILAARFRADLQGMKDLCSKMKIPAFELSGRVHQRERVPQERAFKRVDGAAAMIMQPAATAEGIDLRQAGRTVWYSMTPSWVQFSQLNDRNALHPKAVQHLYILARGTYDEVLYQTSLEDGDVGMRVLKNPELLRRRK